MSGWTLLFISAGLIYWKGMSGWTILFIIGGLIYWTLRSGFKRLPSESLEHSLAVLLPAAHL